jgi:hypothetical protein
MTEPEAVTSVANSAIGAMRSTPLAIALLAVNIVFLVFSTYLLREVSANSRERNKSQVDMINTLIRECHQKQ